MSIKLDEWNNWKHHRKQNRKQVPPSTLVNGNIGPRAVHLLAIKEGIRIFDNASTAYRLPFVDYVAL
ncbi:unnamed protein product [Lactuca virosa]|uniref:Uncharacterized protein n=1 Tax=Lactuca virosa TaxID=75947 RepID=A0AAU9P3B0_9ASTR|nr:unnamed protein product [Lactuca virosa]